MSEREAGERARSVLQVATEVALTMPGRPVPQQVCRHVVLDDGGLLLRLPLGGPLIPAISAARTAVLVEAADVCPIPVRDRIRIRARVWLAGLLKLMESGAALDRTLRALGNPDQVVADRDWAVLHVEVTSVQLAEHGRGRGDACPVPWSDYVGSSPDPLLGVEGAMLTHLYRQHPRELWHLALLAEPELRADRCLIAPIALDRRGLTLRIDTYQPRERASNEKRVGHDVRLAFLDPADSPDAVVRELARLLAQPALVIR